MNGASKLVNDDNENHQRVIFITGGSSGIGEATAREFARSGFKVAITGRNKQRLNNVIEDLKNESPVKENLDDRFLALEADFEDLNQLEKLIEKTVAKFKRLDVLVNNAGFIGQAHSLLHEEFFQEFQSILKVNLLAAARLSQLAAPHLVRSPRGVLVNVSSVLDRVATPNLSYCVSKAGLTMLTKTLANEFEGSKVRVVAVGPGPISTRISPAIDTLAKTTSFGRMGSSEEVARVVKFLESEQASFIHGSTIDIDGGYMARIGITAGPYVPRSAASFSHLFQ